MSDERQPDRLIGMAEVCEVLGRSPSTVRRYLADPQMGFPQPRRLGPQQLAWRESEVIRFIDSLPVLGNRTQG